MFKTLNKIGIYPITLIFLSVLLLVTLIEFSFNSIFFEEYEAYFTIMLSGKLSPGTNYNHLYYYGQIGISNIYALLYSLARNIPWIPVFYEVSLCFALAFFLNTTFSNSKRFNRILVFLLVFCLLHEHFFILNITRTSFVLITLGSLILLQSPLSITKKIVSYCLILMGLLTRPEPAFLSILIILIGDFLLHPNFSIKNRLIRWFQLFWPIFLVLFSLLIYFQIDFKTSNEFYKQIEPDVEYELMVRQNFIPLPETADSTYLLRYQSVQKGIWGDCKTNNNDFLRSLIDKKGNNTLTILQNNYFTLKDLISKNQAIFCLLIFLYFTSLFIAWKKSLKELFLVNVVLISIALTILFVAFQVKMIDRGFVSLLTIGCLIYLLYLQKELQKINTKWLLLFICVFVVFQIFTVHNKLAILKKEVLLNNKCLNQIKPFISHSDYVFLGQSSINVFFLSQTPFGKQTDFKNIFVFNALAFTTIEPYRTYLAKKFKCNPNDYKAFFKFALNENCIFLLNKDESSFLERYLRIVHKLHIRFVAKNKSDFLDATGTPFYAFKIVKI